MVYTCFKTDRSTVGRKRISALLVQCNSMIKGQVKQPLRNVKFQSTVYSIFFFVVLFITCLRLDTLVPIPVQVPVGKKLSKTPMRGFWQKNHCRGYLIGYPLVHRAPHLFCADLTLYIFSSLYLGSRHYSFHLLHAMTKPILIFVVFLHFL